MNCTHLASGAKTIDANTNKSNWTPNLQMQKMNALNQNESGTRVGIMLRRQHHLAKWRHCLSRRSHDSICIRSVWRRWATTIVAAFGPGAARSKAPAQMRLRATTNGGQPKAKRWRLGEPSFVAMKMKSSGKVVAEIEPRPPPPPPPDKRPICWLAGKRARLWPA